MDEDVFMEEAVKEASIGIKHGHGGPFGAVIVSDGRIITKAHNQVFRSMDPTAHAEITAIRQACESLGRIDLSDCEMYSTCEPCPMCLSAIHWARIKALYYGCTRDDAAEIGFDDKLIYDILGGKAKPLFKKKNIGRDACLKVFEQWQKSDSRKIY